MTKHIAFTVLALLSGAAMAQSVTTTSATKVETKSKSNGLKNFKLTLETEMASKRDQNSEVQGNETYLLVEPGYKVSKKVTVMTGIQYKAREVGGTRKGQEAYNKDHLEEAYLKVLYKATKFKDNGIADLRLQARAYSSQDGLFTKRYAADGNYQLRAYFGRPIAGNWSINKYTSYLRYKNYFNNDYSNNRTRDYELRTRISPTYRATKGVDLGMTFTYNHIFKVNKLEDEENVDVDLTARYQKGSYAALVRLGVPYMNNEDGTSVLKTNEDAGKSLGYALTLTAYL